MEYRPYERRDLSGILALCEAEDWPVLPSDPERADRIFTNPGVTTWVALGEEGVSGFIYLLSDGEVQAYVALMAVSQAERRRGIGTTLIETAFATCGAERLDLLSAADAFYENLPNQRWSGFRLHPPFAD